MYAAFTFSTRPAALCCRRCTRSPQPLDRMPRLSPAFARRRFGRYIPGWSGLGLGSGRLIIGAMRRSSTPDDVEPSREVGAGLLHPILAAVASPRLQVRDRYCCLRLEPPTAAGQALLQMFEPYLFGLRQAGTGQEFARGQGSRDGHAAIDTDDLTLTRRGDRLRDHGEREVPATSPVASHPVRLRIRNGTRQPESHPTDLRHVRRGPLPAQFHDPGRLAANDSEPVVQPGFAPGRTPMAPCVES